jgi:glycosyltransferase involved in cell wall biosynthesis
VLSMGNTKPHKDLETLLWAFVRISPVRPDLRLLLVGAEPPGYLDDALRSAPAEASKRVRFTGTVSDDELRGLYGRASVFAFPSRAEGFGLPVLEAMAFGVPVVCARAASLPEVAGDAALLFTPGDTIALADAVSRVLASADLRERLVVGGRERAAGFSWKRTAAMTVAVYGQALGEPAGDMA